MTQPQAPDATIAGEHAAPHGLGRHREHGSRRRCTLNPSETKRAGVGADAEERDVAERQLPGVAEQQVQAHGGDDENAGDDQHVQHVLVVHPQRQREQEQRATAR